MNAISKLFDLTGRTAIVTGASSGLGVTFAEALASAGASVVLAARRVDRLESVKKKITATGGKAEAVACDVGEPQQIEALVAQAVARFGRVDILVNNAGVVAEGGMVPERIPWTVFEQTVRINLLGAWYCAQQCAAKSMLTDGKGGSIVNIASVAGLSGFPDFPSAYQATKAALINLTRNLAGSWADRGVRVNALAPGWFPSEMTDQVMSVPSFRAWTERLAPMGRTGRPEELVAPLLFLASDASSFVTGQTLVVDGGISAAGGERMPEDFMEIVAAMTPHGLGKRIGR
jgi:NAD(P)-dependent dehydrogenase (short-subunit alcohol dehydrogenase family)